MLNKHLPPIEHKILSKGKWALKTWRKNYIQLQEIMKWSWIRLWVPGHKVHSCSLLLSLRTILHRGNAAFTQNFTEHLKIPFHSIWCRIISFLFREEWVSCSSFRLNNLHTITNAAFSTGFLTWSLFLAEGDNSAHHYLGTSLSLWDSLCPIFQWVSNTILTYILGKIIKFPAPGLGTAPTHNSARPGAEMRRPSTSQLITPRAFLLKM